MKIENISMRIYESDKKVLQAQVINISLHVIIAISAWIFIHYKFPDVRSIPVCITLFFFSLVSLVNTIEHEASIKSLKRLNEAKNNPHLSTIFAKLNARSIITESEARTIIAADLTSKITSPQVIREHDRNE